MLLLKDCYKRYDNDLDKACPPEETVGRVMSVFGDQAEILAETKRIDTGRLGIPVYMSMCGPRAREVMPTRKQMGKGSSAVQAEASALMELVERFSFFSFWADEGNFVTCSWSEAMEKFGDSLMPIERVLQSVGDDLSPHEAVEIMDLVRWKFCKALNVSTSQEEYVPLDWFKKLNEFNGSSAGNTYEEAILQGGCELVERHVCAIVDRELPELPTIDPQTFTDQTLVSLYKAFTDNNITLIIKDFSLGFPAPTVGALAYDPASFPHMSEIVFTAGTATSPSKAVIRALTEIAQLAGDFETGSNYEASGLSKYTHLEQIQWLKMGDMVSVEDLPTIEQDNILDELKTLCAGLQAMGYTLYSAATTHPELDQPACYSFIPGFDFRERTLEASLGLFVGRILAEDYSFAEAAEGLELISSIYPRAHFVPFFFGLLHMRMGELNEAERFFSQAAGLQPSKEDSALARFYLAYTLTSRELWVDALPHLDQAIDLDKEVQEFYNLRGVARFKLSDYQNAAHDFQKALNLNGGSAMDYANLGMCYKKLNKKKMAADFFELALGLDPSLDFARQGLDEILNDKV